MFRPLIISLSLAACAYGSASPISSLQFSNEQTLRNPSSASIRLTSNPIATAVNSSTNNSQDIQITLNLVSKATPAANKSTQQSSASTHHTSQQRSQREQLIHLGRSLIGTPYLWGGTTPKGFDCSGFVSYVYGKHGFSLPRTSNEQFSKLHAVDTPAPGDLVFFRGKSGRITHVGMYIGNGNMLHSPQSGEKVRIESIEKPNWKRRYAGARRILPQGNENGAKPTMVAANDATKQQQRVQLNTQTNTGNLFHIK